MEEVLEEIERIKEHELLVVVEGRKDEASLKHFGLTRIKCLNKKPIYKVVEDVVASEKTAIILTDLDKEGKKLYGKLNRQLNFLGVRIDNKLRNLLFRKTKLRQIEGLAKYMERNPR